MGFGAPITALILGIIPFFVFVGSSSTVTVNGVVTESSYLNILGLVLGIIGIVIALRAIFRPAGERAAGPVAVAVIAAVVCAAAIANSVGVISISL